MGRAKGLNPKQQAFVDTFMKTGNATQAARAAGYSYETARHAQRVIMKSPKIKEAIAQAREKSSEISGYTADRAMKEAEKALEFAFQTENANAAVKAVELRSKLSGLLIEKHQVQQVGFSVNIVGIDSPKPEKEVFEIEGQKEVKDDDERRDS